MNDAPRTPERPDLPRATGGSGRAAQVATAVVGILVLVTLGAVFFLQTGDKPGPPQPGASGVPAPPSSGFTPSRTEPLPSLPSVSDLPSQPPRTVCPTSTVAQLTVLTFNVHYGSSGGRDELHRIAAEIKAWKPDVALLQEVDSGRPVSGNRNQAKDLGELTGMHWAYGPNSRNTGAGPRGNAILSRHPIVGSTNTHLPMGGGRELRGVLHAQVDVAGHPVSVYSTHFDHRSPTARKLQGKAVRQIIAKDALPSILGGDLNAGADSRAVKHLRAAGLGDVWAIGEGVGNTAPAGNPRHRIDFLFHDAWLVPLQAVTLRSQFSDHLAVWSRLALRESDC